MLNALGFTPERVAEKNYAINKDNFITLLKKINQNFKLSFIIPIKTLDHTFYKAVVTTKRN